MSETCAPHVVAAFACALLGCAVDERKLAPPPFQAIVTSAGAAGGPSSGGWQGCGDGGAPGASDMVQCWGFDQETGVATNGWTAESGIALSFSQDDASSDPASGSLSVTNQNVGKDDQMLTAGVYQCLPVPYADRYSVEFEALVPPQPVAGGASIELQFINVIGCQGLILGHPQFVDPKALEWQRVTGGGEVPRGARSLLFRLLVGKFHNDPSVEARFDEIKLTFE